MSEWKPIESAPKEELILVIWDGRRCLAKYIDNTDSEYGEWSGWVCPNLFPRPRAESPTLWMALDDLPSPPNGESQ